MIHIQQGKTRANCQGMTRRTAIKAGVLGALGLSLPDVLRARADAPSAQRRDTSVILIWLDGGPSHLESFDPKPDAPAEYRGPYQTIQTSIPGVRFADRVPQHARHANRMNFVRSLHHDNGDHFAAAHWMLTGKFGATAGSQAPRYPSIGSYAARIVGSRERGMPPYVGLPAAQSVYLFPGYAGASYLGPAYDPFQVDNVTRYLGSNSNVEIRRARCVQNLTEPAPGLISERAGILQSLDTMERNLDRSGAMDTLDRYQRQALDLIMSSRARVAFDLDREDPRIAERYGRSPWGRYTLMARRLVEAGVTFVTVDMPYWDDHSGIENGHDIKLRPMDQAVGALMDDLIERGLFESTLVVVMGEFGRTPRINTGQPGIPVPGRDHWGNAFSAVLAGGGLKEGVVVGRTNVRGEHPVERALRPSDIHATIYHVLGIDPNQTFRDHSGRPHPILDDGRAIAELI